MGEVTPISPWCNTVRTLQCVTHPFVWLSGVIKSKNHSSRDPDAKFWDALGILGCVIS